MKEEELKRIDKQRNEFLDKADDPQDGRMHQ